MTEFKQIVGRGTRVHEDTQEVLLHPDRLPRRDQPFRRPGFRRRAGADLRAGRRRPDHAARRRAADRRGRRSAARHAGADETIVDQPGLPLPPGGPIRRRSMSMASAPRIIAERVEYLDENGKLVTESLRDFTKKALKKRFASLDDFLKRWKAAERKQAIIEELEAEGLPLDADRRGTRQGPRSLRPDLPRRLRQEAAHPPRARRERQEARRVHEIRATGPRRARRAARKISPTKACSISTTPTC